MYRLLKKHKLYLKKLCLDCIYFGIDIMMRGRYLLIFLKRCQVLRDAGRIEKSAYREWCVCKNKASLIGEALAYIIR
jgi:hypothetical protein